MAVSLCVTVPWGQPVQPTATFTRPPTDAEIEDGTAKDANDRQRVDPSTVVFKVKDPAGEVSEYDYLGSPVDAVVRDSVGVYHIELDPEQAGTWFYRVDSTGTGAAAGESSFKVAASEFAP